jgi:hypothetical protein
MFNVILTVVDMEYVDGREDREIGRLIYHGNLFTI